jgi:hypothetical protein
LRARIAGSLAPEEEPTFEALLAELPNPEGVNDTLIEELRMRPLTNRREWVKLGMLHPFDRLEAHERAGLPPDTYVASWDDLPKDPGLVFTVLKDA